jgi:hypothetical protein
MSTNTNNDINNNTTWEVSTTDSENSSGPTESSSETQVLWGNIIFSLLWFVGITLLIILIVCMVQSSKQGANGSSVDVEEQAPPKNGGDNQKSHGRRWILLIPLFAVLVATSLSIVANTSCEFVKLVVWSSSSPISDPMSIGIWSVAFPNTYDTSYFSKGTCYHYRQDSEVLDQLHYHEDEETAMKLARVSAVLATIVGAAGMVAFLYYCYESVNHNTRPHGVLIAVFVMVAVMQAITFAVFRTDYCVNHFNLQCQRGDGAVSSFTSLYYWLLVAVGLFAVRLQNNKNNNSTSEHN